MAPSDPKLIYSLREIGTVSFSWIARTKTNIVVSAKEPLHNFFFFFLHVIFLQMIISAYEKMWMLWFMSNHWLSSCTTNYKILVSPCAGNSNWPDFLKTEEMQRKQRMLVNKKTSITRRYCVQDATGNKIRKMKCVFICSCVYVRPQLVTDGKQITFRSGWSWIIGHLWRDRRAQGPGAMKQS